MKVANGVGNSQMMSLTRISTSTGVMSWNYISG